MRLEEIHTRYSAASAKASEVGRQLAFAGIAIVWLFSGGETNDSGGLDIPPDLLRPGLFLVLTLGFDFLHATYAAGAWGAFGRVLERRGRTDHIELPRWIHWPSLFFFWTKLACLGLGYLLLAVYFVDRL
jgi:hypothetical protein